MTLKLICTCTTQFYYIIILCTCTMSCIHALLIIIMYSYVHLYILLFTCTHYINSSVPMVWAEPVATSKLVEFPQRKFYSKHSWANILYTCTLHYFCQKKFFVNFASLSTLSSSVETLARYDLMETSMPMNVIIDRNTRANGINRATIGFSVYTLFSSTF